MRVEVNRIQNKVKIKYKQGTAQIEFITEDVIHIVADIQKEPNFSLLEIAPVQKKVEIEVIEEEGEVTLKTKHLRLKIDEYFKVTIYDCNGNIVCRDYKGTRQQTKGLDHASKSLLKKEGQEEGRSKEAYKIEVIKCMEQDEAFYGLGDKTGFLNKRGYEYEMWNTDDPMPHVESYKSLYKSIPFLIVLRKNCVFGMYFNNPYKSYYDLGKEDSNYYYFASNDGALDYYFIYGKNMKEVITEYTYLTGRTPRPPMWSLGYHQSRWGYDTAEEVYEIAQQFRQRKIPCDTMHLDLSYMEGCRIFTWNKKNFKDPEQFLKEIYDKGFHVVPIIDPGVKVEKGYSIYEEGVAKDCFAKTSEGDIYTNEVWPGEVAYPNFINATVRKWWGEKHKDLLDMKITGIWNDMNEPASFEGEIPENVMFKKDAIVLREASNSLNSGYLMHKQIHNLYGHFMAKATFEGVQEYTGKRPFILTRACFSGTQKYAAVWTGDNHSLWAHLQMSIPQLCNLGLSGFPFVGCDVGGYGSDVTKELLVRWYQVGCFYPFFRNHNTLSSRSQEPWVFDEESLEIINTYIRLRYQLLPYIYDSFIQEEQTGLPILRPLILEYEDDPMVQNLNDEFMVGENILVAPIVEQGKTYRAIYLPEGEWIDYWTEEKITGKQVILKEAPLSICPIYVKVGSIIPMYEVMQYVGEKSVKRLILNVYEKAGSYTHYQDNGEDYSYQQGEYNRYQFTVKDNILYAEKTYKGYKKDYQLLDILYQGERYEVPFCEDEIRVAL